MSRANPWTTLGSRVVYSNPWLRLREDQVLRPDGNPGIYSVIDTRVAVGVVALTETREVVLIGQYRYPTRRWSWEIVEGGVEAGETAESTAVRELQEEAGLRAGRLSTLGAEVQMSNCISSEMACFFLAEKLATVPASPEPTEVLERRMVPLEKALAMVERGEISDAMSIIGLARAWQCLEAGRPGPSS
jgi:8-oxo-dGTP pyrophosphatase MutT (NUDIX family)